MNDAVLACWGTIQPGINPANQSEPIIHFTALRDVPYWVSGYHHGHCFVDAELLILIA